MSGRPAEINNAIDNQRYHVEKLREHEARINGAIRDLRDLWGEFPGSGNLDVIADHIAIPNAILIMRECRDTVSHDLHVARQELEGLKRSLEEVHRKLPEAASGGSDT